MRTSGRKRTERATGRGYRLWIWLAAVVVALAVLTVTFSPKRKVMPDELIGVWTTNDPAYQDRFLAIYSGTVSFGTGSGTVTTGFVRNVEQVPQRGEIVYSLTYSSDEGDQNLSFSYEPERGFLRLKNQAKIVWTKSGKS